MAEPSTPAEQIEGTQEQPCRARSGPPTESSGRPAVSAGHETAATPEVDAFQLLYGYRSPEGAVEAFAEMVRQRNEARKVIAVVRKCTHISGTIMRGLKDDNPYKGPLNYLVDALDAYDAAIAREKAMERSTMTSTNQHAKGEE